MHQLMKFEATPVDIQMINGVWMLELYSVGMALGYARSNGKQKGEHGVHPKNRTLFPYKSRIDKVVQNAEIKPFVRDGHKYITESQLYDFMLEARTDKCRAFRKWLTNEVLPALNRTGTYSVPTKEEQLTLPVEQPYQYRKRTYDGKLVFTVADMVHFTGLSRDQIHRVLKRKGLEIWDYYELKHTELLKFKRENHESHSTANHMIIITQAGTKCLCDTFHIDLVMPELVPMKKPAQVIQPPSDALNSLMGYVQRETEAIQATSKLLQSTDTKEHLEVYRSTLLRHIARLRDLRFNVETILI